MNATDLSEIRYCITAVLVLHQPEVSSSMETTASDIDIPVEVTGCHMQPVIVPETVNLSR